MAGVLGMESSKATRPADVAKFEPGWLGSVDRRTSMYMALRARLSELHTDLGGAENLSVQRHMICERVVFIEMQVRDMETRALNGDREVDFGRYGFLSNVLTGLLKTLGLDRQTKPIQSLQDYIASKEASGD